MRVTTTVTETIAVVDIGALSSTATDDGVGDEVAVAVTDSVKEAVPVMVIDSVKEVVAEAV